MKKCYLLIVAILLLTTVAFGQSSTHPNTVYKQIKSMSSASVEKRIDQIAGQNDDWKNNINLKTFWQKAVSSLPLSMQGWFGRFKTGDAKIDEMNEFRYLTALAQKKPRSLLAGYLLASRSENVVLRNIAPSIKGEKRSFANDRGTVSGKIRQFIHERSSAQSILFFLINMSNGNTFYDVNRFFTFRLRFSTSADDFERAAKTAVENNLPVVVEFESSALDEARSPLTYHIANQAIAKALKIAQTPDGGQVVVLHPDVATKLASEFEDISKRLDTEFNRVKATLTNNLENRTRLIEMIQTGDGLIPHKVLNPPTPTCVELFEI